MKYLKQLREIDSEVYRNIGIASQLLIDFVQETIQDLDRDYEEQPIERDELGALTYEIENLLEIYNPKKGYDILVLNRFNKVLEDWYNDVEFINSTLGIAPNKG